jgi:hypothetical protein
VPELGDTPENGVKLTPKGVVLPWGKILSWIVGAGAVATPVGAIGVWKSHGDVQASVSEKSARLDAKLDQILEGQTRVEHKVDGLEERVRGVELTQARQDGKREKEERR